jgi:hypothetical protein
LRSGEGSEREWKDPDTASCTTPQEGSSLEALTLGMANHKKVKDSVTLFAEKIPNVTNTMKKILTLRNPVYEKVLHMFLVLSFL